MLYLCILYACAQKVALCKFEIAFSPLYNARSTFLYYVRPPRYINKPSFNTVELIHVSSMGNFSRATIHQSPIFSICSLPSTKAW